MSIIKSHITKLTVTGVFCALLAAPALALDTDVVLQRLEKTLNASNVTVIGGNVTTEGSDIIVENFGIEAASLDEADNLTLRLHDIVEAGDGSFTIGKLSVDDASVTIAGDRIDFSGFEVEQFYLPAESAPVHGNAYQPYKNLSLKGFTLYNKGAPSLRASNTYTGVSDFEAGKRIKYQGAIENLSFVIDRLGDEAAQSIKDIGYDSINGRVEFSGGTDFETGLFEIGNLALNFDNIGTLSMSLQFGGYTPTVAKAMVEMSAKADDSQAATLALMGVAQQLNFKSFSLRFEDHSITEKALDYAAENMGSSRSDVITMASAMAQFGLANLHHADFATKVSQALSSYLNAPKSIEIVAAPPQPLPLMVVAGSAQNPKDLIDILNVEVNANQ